MPPSTETRNYETVYTYKADHTFSSALGAVGTWKQRGQVVIGDTRQYLPVMWAELLKSRGFAGTFEVTEFSYKGPVTAKKLKMKLNYKGIAHVTSPAVMDVPITVNSTHLGTRVKVKAEMGAPEDLVQDLLEGYATFNK